MCRSRGPTSPTTTGIDGSAGRAPQLGFRSRLPLRQLVRRDDGAWPRVAGRAVSGAQAPLRTTPAFAGIIQSLPALSPLHRPDDRFMPDIQAFRALRYDLGQVGSLSDVIAPPYDVIDSELQDQLYKAHPANVIRLILNREEPGDPADEKYRRAARILKHWRRDGVLQQDAAASLYVYHQTFNVEGVELVRRGFMARVKVEPFGEGAIFPHEETHSAAKADRLKLTRACQANLSQIFGSTPIRRMPRKIASSWRSPRLPRSRPPITWESFTEFGL